MKIKKIIKISLFVLIAFFALNITSVKAESDNKSVTVNVYQNGSCSSPATAYSCLVGTSTSNVNGASAWTWTCSGVNGGSDASCSQAKAPVDCVGGWVDNSTCSASCGGGVKQQTYTITTPAANGGTSCPYANGATQWGSTSCNTTVCPVNCVGSWSDNSTCSASCGGGVKQQTYNITTPAAGTGTTCPYTNGATQWGSTSCNTQSCGSAASWSGYGACSGGSQSGYCTEATGGYTPTCAGLGFSAGTNTRTCGTAASWSGYGACSNGSKSGYCTEASGGGAPTCAGLGYSSGTNTTSCGTPGVCSASHYSCSVGTSVSNSSNFTTWNWVCNGVSGGYNTSCGENKSAPTISTTTPVTNITQTTAHGTGNITSDGGAAVTVSGLVWHVSTNPTTSMYTGKTTDGWAIGGPWTGTSDMTGLSCGTTYYVRAYATNAVGTSYGSNVSFATSACAVSATISTVTPVTNITQTTATGGGNTVSNGGAAVTVSGLVWHVSTNPTTSIYSGITYNGWAIGGPWASDITGLACGTTYYVRAYATNAMGTSYGSNVSFATSACNAIPSVSSQSSSAVSYKSATLNASVTSLGVPASISARGFCYGTMTGPSLSNGAICGVEGGSTVGAYSINIVNILSPETTYYYRGYATNPSGTGYTTEGSFTTVPLPPPPDVTFWEINNKTSVVAGDPIDLKWSTVRATSCAMTSSPSSLVNLPNLSANPATARRFNPTKTTIYRLKCTGDGGSLEKILKINVGTLKPTFNEI